MPEREALPFTSLPARTVTMTVDEGRLNCAPLVLPGCPDEDGTYCMAGSLPGIYKHTKLKPPNQRLNLTAKTRQVSLFVSKRTNASRKCI